MLIRLLVVLVLCTFNGALKANAGVPLPDQELEDVQNFLNAAEEENRDDQQERQLPPPTEAPAPAPGVTTVAPAPPPTQAPLAPGVTTAAPVPPPTEAPAAPGTPTNAPAPAPAPGEPSLEVPATVFNVSKLKDWTFQLALKIKPEAAADKVHFVEGDKKVKMGESTKSLDFKAGKVENGLLLIPVQVKDHKEQKLTFKVEFEGKSKEITVNVEGEKKPTFELLKDTYKVTLDDKWRFMIAIKADKMQSYSFKEGGKTAKPGESTKSLRFGDVVKMGEKHEYHVTVHVINLAPNNINFTITSGHTTENAKVVIEPPHKPILLKHKFAVSKANNFTFELEIKSKTPPMALKFTEGNSTVKPGNKTKSFTFGQLTNDMPNLYNVEVKTTSDIDKPRHFDVFLNGNITKVEVSKGEESSAMSSAPLSLICVLLPILMTFLR